VTLSGEQLQQTARDTAARLEHVSAGRPFTPHLEVWKVRERVFLIVTEDEPDLQIITVKADPNHADALRRDHESITPSHYLDKHHWISVGPGPKVTKRLIENLVHDSYDLADSSSAVDNTRPGGPFA
jgi:predicted DNA-binding protein (MmcQ/YjbR family)